MSQNKQTLGIIERESGLEGLLVRPLSALLLPETIPQQKGWIKKEFLFDIKGRGRRRQMNLAGEWGITDYPWPGGGCLLTDPTFSRRLKDIMRNGTLTLDNIELLKIGRHFKIRPKFKLIVGRNEEENKKLISIARPGDTVFEPLNVPGPTGIGRGLYDEDVKSVSSKIIARYTAEDKKISVKVTHRPTNLKEIFKVSGISEGEIVRLRI